MLKMQIGNLPPGKSAEIIVKYVTELQYEEGALRFELPNTRCLPLLKEQLFDNSVTGFTFSADIEAPSDLVSIRSSAKITTQLEKTRATVQFNAPEMSDAFWMEMTMDQSSTVFTVVEEVHTICISTY